MSYAPEVLAALAARLRREEHAAVQPPWPPTFGELTHELTRDDVTAAHNGWVLILDRAATSFLGGLGG